MTEMHFVVGYGVIAFLVIVGNAVYDVLTKCLDSSRAESSLFYAIMAGAFWPLAFLLLVFSGLTKLMSWLSIRITKRARSRQERVYR